MLCEVADTNRECLSLRQDNIMGLVVSLMSGLLFFQEYRLFTFYTFAVFSSGIALSIGGLALLMIGSDSRTS